MKIYNTNVRYFCCGKIHCFITRAGAVKVAGFDNVLKRRAILNISNQKSYGC